MKHLLLWIAFICLAASCKKDPITNVPIDTPVKDIQTIRLKEVIEPGLPSPYYRFIYTDSGYISNIDFADGLVTYAITYNDHRISQVVNTKLNEQLTYYYTNGNVSYITLKNAPGNKQLSYTMGYNNSRQLIEVKWHLFENNTQDSLTERKVALSYDAKGNLSKIEDYRLDANNELKISRTALYADYDNGINTDDLYLLKSDFMEHLLYLPQVKFQKNNPRVVVIKSGENEFRVDYTYTYYNNLPVTKSIRMEQTAGDEAGKVSHFTNRYSYY